MNEDKEWNWTGYALAVIWLSIVFMGGFRCGSIWRRNRDVKLEAPVAERFYWDGYDAGERAGLWESRRMRDGRD